MELSRTPRPNDPALSCAARPCEGPSHRVPARRVCCSAWFGQVAQGRVARVPAERGSLLMAGCRDAALGRWQPLGSGGCRSRVPAVRACGSPPTDRFVVPDRWSPSGVGGDRAHQAEPSAQRPKHAGLPPASAVAPGASPRPDRSGVTSTLATYLAELGISLTDLSSPNRAAIAIYHRGAFGAAGGASDGGAGACG